MNLKISAALVFLFACAAINRTSGHFSPTRSDSLRDSLSDDFQNLRDNLESPTPSSPLKGKPLKEEKSASLSSAAGDSFSGDLSPVVAPSARELILEFRGVETIGLQRSSQKGLREGVEAELHDLISKLSDPKILSLYGIDPASSEEIGVLQNGMDVEILSDDKSDYGGIFDEHRVRFKATARALIHEKAARVWIDKGSLFVYRRAKGTSKERVISTKPRPPEKGLELEAEIRVKPALSPAGLARYESQSAQLPAIRGDNGNAELFEIYAAQGFYGDWFRKRDDGWRIFKSLNRFLLQNGFSQAVVLDDPDRKRYSFSKEIKTASGKTLGVRFHHLISDTEPDADSADIFAAFMREAVREGDVVLYGGHSGLGINLSLKTLNSTLRNFGQGPIRFPDKKQIYFFDTCYGYKDYSQAYREMSRRRNIDVVTYGIMSDFVGAEAVWKELLDVLMDPGEDPSWMELLKRLEKAQNGQTYLINVGGL